MKLISKNILDLSIGSVLMVLLFLAGINYLAAQKYIYFDLTQDKVYTTSDATKNILKNLNKEVKVTFYISKDLPVDFLNIETQLKDLMNQYQGIAGSKLKITYETPENTPEKVQELAEIGIPQIQVNVKDKDKLEVKQGFFGAVIASGEGEFASTEQIPIIQSMANIEYDFISAVYAVSRESKENLAFLEGQGEKQINLPDLQKYYNVSAVKIMSAGDKKGFYAEKPAAKQGDKPEQIFITPKTLIVSAPATEMPKEEISVIEDYVKGGGNLVVLSEMVNVDTQNNLNAAPIKNNLNDLIKKYGVEINADLIYDRYNSNITYSQGYFTTSTPYPYFVRAQKDNFGDSASLSGLQALIFPWVSSLALNDAGDYAPKVLIRSSDQSDSVSGTFNLMPNTALSVPKSPKKVIAALSMPKDSGTQGGSVAVIGDSDFVSSQFVGNAPDNATFFMNLVDSISSSAGLSTIRAKTIADRPIKELDETEKNYWKFSAIFAAALVLDVYGFFRIMRRKKGNA